jgi:hypothetical protein
VALDEKARRCAAAGSLAAMTRCTVAHACRRRSRRSVATVLNAVLARKLELPVPAAGRQLELPGLAAVRGFFLDLD